MTAGVSILDKGIQNPYTRVAMFHKLYQAYWVCDDVLPSDLEKVVEVWDTVPADIILQLEQELMDEMQIHRIRGKQFNEDSCRTEKRFDYLCSQHNIPLEFASFAERMWHPACGDTLRTLDVFPVTNLWKIIKRKLDLES